MPTRQSRKMLPTECFSRDMISVDRSVKRSYFPFLVITRFCDERLEIHCGPEYPKIQTEVLGHSLVRSLVRSHRSFVRSLAHFAHSLARGTVIDSMAIYSVFFSILAHSGSERG